MTQELSVKTQANGTRQEQRPDPEVVPQAKRRAFSAAYKLRILEEADRCDQRGQIGDLLRREGLYSSHLTTWRRQRATGQLSGLSPKRGRKKDEQIAEVAALRRENERLRAQLNQAELIITAQKKLAQALEQTLSRDEDEIS
jgi:transposase